MVAYPHDRHRVRSAGGSPVTMTSRGPPRARARRQEPGERSVGDVGQRAQAARAACCSLNVVGQLAVCVSACVVAAFIVGNVSRRRRSRTNRGSRRARPSPSPSRACSGFVSFAASPRFLLRLGGLPDGLRGLRPLDAPEPPPVARDALHRCLAGRRRAPVLRPVVQAVPQAVALSTTSQVRSCFLYRATRRVPAAKSLFSIGMFVAPLASPPEGVSLATPYIALVPDEVNGSSSPSLVKFRTCTSCVAGVRSGQRRLTRAERRFPPYPAAPPPPSPSGRIDNSCSDRARTR